MTKTHKKNRFFVLSSAIFLLCLTVFAKPGFSAPITNQSMTVSIFPEEARIHGAWSIDGGKTWFEHGTVLHLNNGDYILIARPVGGYVYPEPIKIEVTRNKHNVYDLVYREIPNPVQNLYIWGENGSGQIGTGDNINKTEPYQIIDAFENAYSSIVVPFPESVKEVVLGDRHSVALLANGEVYVWGRNDYGQLGLGKDTSGKPIGDKTRPVKIPFEWESPVKHVYVSAHSTYALTESGKLYGWGRNNKGQLATREFSNRISPKIMELSLDSEIREVIPGFQFCFILTEIGDVYGWGDNSKIQISENDVKEITSPMKIKDLKDIVEISTGETHFVAKDSKGKIYSWGTGPVNSENMEISEIICPVQGHPFKVPFSSKPWKIIALHSASFILFENGELYAWGIGSGGQLGVDTKDNFLLPVKIKNLPPVFDIYGGSKSMYAFGTDGKIYSWGTAAAKQLLRQDTSNLDTLSPAPTFLSTKRVSSMSLSKHSQIYEHVAFIRSEEKEEPLFDKKPGYAGIKINTGDDSIKWRIDDLGPFSNNEKVYVLPGKRLISFVNEENRNSKAGTMNVPIPLPCETIVLEADKFIEQEKQLKYTALNDFKLYIWGKNERGLASQGNTEIIQGPRFVSRMFHPDIQSQTCNLLANPIDVDLGESHSIVLFDNSDVCTAGSNNNGQLGLETIGLMSDRHYLHALNFNWNSSPKQVFAGSNSNYALCEKGDLYSWGSNSHGQLGTGSFKDTYIPTKVQIDKKIVSVSTNRNSVLALDESGCLWGFGNNDSGQLGLGNEPKISTPERIKNLNNITSFALGDTHAISCASDGTAYTWGRGILSGKRSYSDTPLKVNISNTVKAKAVAAGSDFSVILSSTGEVYSWGSGMDGRMGLDDPSASEPVKIPKIPPVSGVTAAGNSLFLHLVDGDTMVSGGNSFDKLALDNSKDVAVPVLSKFYSEHSLVKVVPNRHIRSHDSIAAILKNRDSY